MEPDLDVVQRIARATCAELHRNALDRGLLVRPRKDPGQYMARSVFPIVYAAVSTGLIQEVRGE